MTCKTCIVSPLMVVEMMMMVMMVEMVMTTNDGDSGDNDGNDCNENTKMCCRKENGAGSLTLGQFHFSVLILLMLLLQS